MICGALVAKTRERRMDACEWIISVSIDTQGADTPLVAVALANEEVVWGWWW